MTNKHTKPAMDKLDLDSFLNSHSDDDDDSSSIPHRSLDEILNDSDSSTSSPSSPRFEDDIISEHSVPNSVTRVNSAVLLSSSSTDQSWRRSLPPPPPPSRPLPPLFGGVRSNAKPGDALAAAAAASRSMPTPHAAAIKSRRARALEKVVDQDIVSDSVSSNEESSVVVDTEHMDSGGGIGDFVSALNDQIFVKDSSFEIWDAKDLVHGQELSVSHANLDLNDDTVRASTSGSESNVELNVEGNGKIEENVAVASVVVAEDEPKLLDEDETNEIAEEKINEDMNMAPLQEAANLHEVTFSEKDDGGDDSSTISEISEMVEERIGQLESEISKRAEKKLKSSKKPLELAEELEKKQASTGLHWEEGAAAQPMRLEGVRRGSTTLGYFNTDDANNVVTGTISSQAFRRDYGSPQVLAVHLNYVAVGMAKGVIVVFPSKYSPHTTDNMDAKMLILGLQGDRSHAPVTSMCFNQQGDLLLAGYGDGHITLWDVQRAASAKVITGEHSAPVVHVLFLGQDSQVTRQFKAVTGDNKGLVLLHTISVFPLFNRFTIKTQCLLDGQKTGIVVSVSPLLFDELSGDALPSSQGNTSIPSSGIGSMMGGVVGGDAGWKLFNEGSSLVEEGVVIFVTHQNALVVRLSPTLEVYAQLSRPDGVREGSMPYTAWKCTTQSHGSSSANIPGDSVERVSLLALAWDRKVQVAKLVKSELKVYGKWSLDSPAIGVTWLDSHMLVVLTLTGHLYLFAKDGSIIHQTSFAIDNAGADDLAAYHTHFTNVYGNPEKSYHNCVAVRGASVYILGPGRLVVSRLLPWKERIQVLRLAGDWMGALNMAMTLYDGQAHGILDLPNSIEALQETIMPYLVELLLSYVDEVFSYISVAFCNQIGKVEQQDDSNSGTSPVQHEIKEQYTRVGGVAVEFCVHIRRTDLLFDEIFSKFIAVQHRDTFLELLEPYILKDMLGSLPPEIMQALVEHYSRKGWLQRVEQCVLHMDISSLDFNQVVRICREHGLYGALVYLFNKGLGDFRTPLEELLVVSQKSQQESSYALGYRTLVYLKYCFSGLSFPPGHGALPPDRLPSIRTELVQFLLESSPAATSQVSSSSPFRGKYLNLYHLLELDTEATLDVLRYAFMDGETLSHDAIVNLMANQDNNAVAGTRYFVQNTIDALVQILENNKSQSSESANNDTSGLVEAWPANKDLGYLFEFIAHFVAHGESRVSNGMLLHILEYLTSEFNHQQSVSVETSKTREKQVLSLLEVVPETEWNASYVLQLCEKANFHQVCGLIYTFRHQYVAALESYMRDMDEPIHTFSYIDHMLQRLSSDDLDAFRSAVMSRIPELVILSRECTFFLVVDQFNNEIPHILSELNSQPKSLFLYLKTVIEVHLSGTLDFSNLRKDDNVKSFNARKPKDQSKELATYSERISDFPKFMRNCPINVTDGMIELYLELLCQYERDSVLKFLETFDSYRVEHCLRLCQQYGITDAAAFLLERVGDVGSALLLTLSGLNNKFNELDTAVLNAVSRKGLKGSSSSEQYITLSKIKEVDEIRSTLDTCIGLCQRNSPRLEPEESEILWFRLLDSFCEALMDTYGADKGLLKEENRGILAEAFGSHKEDDACIIKWKISKSHKGAHILRKLLSQFIKEIVEGMIGYVRLPTIMSKLLSDNGNQEFGDFKVTILGMLGTYGFERRILDTAKSLIEDDTFYTMSLLKKGASHGYAPRNPVCCICSCNLTKNSQSFQIRVFSCGHATHLECEHLESESSSGGPLYGCPVCMPKKSTHRPRDKSAFPYDSLVKKGSSRPHRSQKSGVLHQYEDLLENSHGFQQIPRFEMLTNLQKEQRIIQIENMPQLRLAPPAVYHEKKVKKRPELVTGESSSDHGNNQKGNRSRKLRELKVKGSSLRFPLKSSIFGKEKANRE